MACQLGAGAVGLVASGGSVAQAFCALTTCLVARSSPPAPPGLSPARAPPPLAGDRPARTPVLAAEHGYIVRIDSLAISEAAARVRGGAEVILHASVGSFVGFRGYPTPAEVLKRIADNYVKAAQAAQV